MSDSQIISLAAILFPVVVSVCSYLYKKYVPLDKQAQLAQASSIVGVVVQGVEQACVVLNGPDKKSEAIRIINQLLGESKINVSPTLVDALIEQAVYSINQNVDTAPTKLLPVVKPQ